MSLYFFRCCLGFNLITMFHVSVVVLAYLCGRQNEFKCNQWERKGMHTDVYFYI